MAVFTFLCKLCFAPSYRSFTSFFHILNRWTGSEFIFLYLWFNPSLKTIASIKNQKFFRLVFLYLFYTYFRGIDIYYKHTLVTIIWLRIIRSVYCELCFLTLVSVKMLFRIRPMSPYKNARAIISHVRCSLWQPRETTKVLILIASM